MRIILVVRAGADANSAIAILLGPELKTAFHLDRPLAHAGQIGDAEWFVGRPVHGDGFRWTTGSALFTNLAKRPHPEIGRHIMG